MEVVPDELQREHERVDRLRRPLRGERAMATVRALGGSLSDSVQRVDCRNIGIRVGSDV